MRPTPALTVAAALLAACSAGAVRPPDAREVAYFRAAQAQAVRGEVLLDLFDALLAEVRDGRQLGLRLRDQVADGLDPDLGRARAEELSRAAAAALGWSENQRQQELARFYRETDRIYPAMVPQALTRQRIA